MARNVYRQLILGLLLMPALAGAGLSHLETDFTPAHHYVIPGETMIVTAQGDPGLDLEYAFAVQRYTMREYLAGQWQTVISRPWDASSALLVDSQAKPLRDGTYRVISMVRKTGMPDDYLFTSTQFVVGEPIDELCSYLDGKVYFNDETVATTVDLGFVSIVDAIKALNPPGWNVSLYYYASAFTLFRFDDGTVKVMPNSQWGIDGSGVAPSEATAVFSAPFMGTYTCDGNVVWVQAQGATSEIINWAGYPPVIYADTFYAQTSGYVIVDIIAGTLTTGGTTFRQPWMPDPDEAIDPCTIIDCGVATDPVETIESKNDDGGAFLLLPLLGLLGLRRRRTG